MNKYPGSAEPQLRINTEHEWHSRGYLPHRDRLGLLQIITFRLADCLSQEKLKELEEELLVTARDAELGLRVPSVEVERRKRIENWLDAGMGCCALRHPQMAKVVEDTLLKFDGSKYKLIAWCIMPNHVHVLIEPLIELKKIIQSWKSYTGRWALKYNAELGLRVPGENFWMADYWDRYIRDEKHFASAIEYIHNNPVKGALCPSPEKWQWSSVRFLEQIGRASCRERV